MPRPRSSTTASWLLLKSGQRRVAAGNLFSNLLHFTGVDHSDGPPLALVEENIEASLERRIELGRRAEAGAIANGRCCCFRRKSGQSWGNYDRRKDGAFAQTQASEP